MAVIYIENQPHEADPKTNLLQAALSLGFDLPYFCWHPALGSVGACRQCAVKQYRDENDKQGRIVMSCMVPADEGVRISIDDPEAREFRAGVIEWLMTNHPHDCPVCDEGGECHLQDVTVMTGHAYRRFRFKKRTFTNQYLGPFINHEMNRCIQCYRCVRYYRDYADGRDLDAFAAHNHVYFGRHEDGVLENEFSGNLVEVCPTGVFTDKTLKLHYTRKWDLQSAPSVCAHCAVGCNTIAGERYGTLRRILNRYNGEVNGYFLCDRGRFGYEFVNSGKRIRRPSISVAAGAGRADADASAALEHLRGLTGPSARVIGIGSPRASLESNFALRALVGADQFHQGVSDREAGLLARSLELMRSGPYRIPSMREIEQADAVLILGEDLTNTAPRAALAVRQAVRNQPIAMVDRLRIPRWLDQGVRNALQGRKGPLFIGAVGPTRLDDIATRCLRAAPSELARAGRALAHRLDPAAPAPGDAGTEDADRFVEEASAALAAAERPLVIAGISLGSEAVLTAAAGVARSLAAAGRDAALSLVFPEANSLGVGLLGGGTLSDAMAKSDRGEVDAVIILENDLYRRAPRANVDAFLGGNVRVIALDALSNPTTEAADVVLPAGSFAESDGTIVNSEGRAQRFFQVISPESEVQEGWRWLGKLAEAAGRSGAGPWSGLDAVLDALAAEFPELAAIRGAAPGAEFRIAGQKIPRSSRRYSGRTAMRANIDVSEPKPPDDPDSPMSFSMEGHPCRPPAALTNLIWAPGWNSAQAIGKFQEEINGSMAGGDPGVRLIEPVGNAKAPYPVATEAGSTGGGLLAVPLHHIFESEELSSQAPAVAARAPAPSVTMHPEDAAGLGLEEGAPLRVAVGDAEIELLLRIEPKLARGLVGLPAGRSETAGLELPARIEIRKGGS